MGSLSKYNYNKADKLVTLLVSSQNHELHVLVLDNITFFSLGNYFKSIFNFKMTYNMRLK